MIDELLGDLEVAVSGQGLCQDEADGIADGDRDPECGDSQASEVAFDRAGQQTSGRRLALGEAVQHREPGFELRFGDLFLRRQQAVAPGRP